MQNEKLKMEDIIFENRDGSSYCKFKFKDVFFIISYIGNDKYSVEFEKNGVRPKTKINGKIFIDNAKTMKNNLIEAITNDLSIDKFESTVIVNNLWKNLATGNLSDVVFSLTANKSQESVQFVRKFESLTIDYYDMALKLLEDNHFITFIDTKEILKYENGVYVSEGKEKIEELITNLIKNRATVPRMNEVIKKIQQKTYVYRDKLDMNLNLINLQNGMFDIEKNILIPHSPDYKSIRQLPVKYDKDATCPEIEKFMRTTVNEDEIAPLYEVIGYSMIPKINIKNSTLMLTGTGDNGKSVYLNIAKAFIGHDNVSLESLQRLEENAYATSNLYGKLLNVFADLSSKNLYENGMFKILTGHDGPIQAERKFQHPFNFINTARMMFSANKLPSVPDDDLKAFFSRLIVIPFTKNFTVKNADKNLNEKVITDKELSGLFNIVIESLRNVLDKNEFSYNKSVADIEKIYRTYSDDVLVFAGEKIQEDDNDAAIPKELMYKVYESWCKENGIIIKSKNKFTRRLTSLGFFVGKKGSGDKQTRSWMNCKFKSTKDNEQQKEIQENKPLIQVPLVKIER